MTSKPKTLLYCDALAAVEQRIVDALPEIIDELINRAKQGDVKAAVYLCDRMLGRAAGSAVSPADDRRLPYSEDAFRLEQQEREGSEALRRMIAGLGANNGV